MVAVVVATGFGVYAGIQAGQQNQAAVPVMPLPVHIPMAGPGAHCGGNMTTAATCVNGYHCASAPGSHLPFGDVGGLCAAD